MKLRTETTDGRIRSRREGLNMVKVEKLPRSEAWNKAAGWSCYLVKRGEQIIGLLSKHRDKGAPWLVDAGYGWDARFIGTAPDKKAAVAKLLQELTL